jgi:hypothetical protein
VQVGPATFNLDLLDLFIFNNSSVLVISNGCMGSFTKSSVLTATSVLISIFGFLGTVILCALTGTKQLNNVISMRERERERERERAFFN